MNTATIEQAITQRLQQIAEWGSVGDRVPRRLIYMIEITGFCSLGCPVCCASAGPIPNLHMPLGRILALGRKIRDDGGRLVQLIGGEPAEHPNVVEIVSGLRRIGLRPSMATNGLRLAEESSFAARLRRGGLRKVNIQFDTFNADTSIAMRGRNLISLKCKAVANAASAGIRVGLIATMCDRNVHETSGILQYALSHMPELNTVTFQTMTLSGRFPADIYPVDRPTILCHLLKTTSEIGLDLSPQDILPPPQYPPWRSLTHPECASMMFLCRDGSTLPVWPLGRDVNLEQFYAMLQTVDTTGHGMCNSVFRPALALWRSTRRGARLATLQRMIALATGRGKRSLCVIQIDAVMDSANSDPERARRCPACFVTEQGFKNVCARYWDSPEEGRPAP